MVTGEGRMLESEAPLRECSVSWQTKYLINDSQHTHKDTCAHTYILNYNSPQTKNEVEFNVPLQQFLLKGPDLKSER